MSKLMMEADLRGSKPDLGFEEDRIIPTRAWVRGADSLVLTAATKPKAIVFDGFDVLEWVFDAVAADVGAYQFQMPGYFARRVNCPKVAGPYRAGDFALYCQARKVDGVDENADLALQCQVVWWTPGTAAKQSLTTPARATLAASSIVGTIGDVTAGYTLDIGARLAAEGKEIRPGDVVRLQLGPHEQVGTTDMTMQVVSTRLRMRRHAADWDESIR